MKFRKMVLLAVLIVVQGLGYSSLADGNADIEALKKLVEEQNKKIDALTQKVHDLEEREQGKSATAARIEAVDQKVQAIEQEKSKTTPRLSISSEGFTMSSADTNFTLRLRGIVQVDSRTFLDDHGLRGNDGFLLRRVRPIIEGTLYHDFDFVIVPDFGTGGNGGAAAAPQVFDAWLNYTYSSALQFRFGKFKLPVGLEALQADPDTMFNERSFASQLISIRDVGAQMQGQVLNGRLSYAGGVFNGVGDNRNSSNSDFDDEKEFAGRLFAQPFKSSRFGCLKGFGFGLGGSYTRSFTAAGLPNTTGGTNPGFVTDGQQQFFSYKSTVTAAGNHWRLSPQFYYYWGPFDLMGEYIVSSQEVSFTTSAKTRRFDNSAWEVNASWVLTGENAGYQGIIPDHPFNPHSGQWGAWQLVARYEQLDLDRSIFSRKPALSYADPAVSAKEAQAWSVGLNWWMNKNVRVNGSFTRTTFSGGGGAGAAAPATVTRQPENVIFTRVQLAF